MEYFVVECYCTCIIEILRYFFILQSLTTSKMRKFQTFLDWKLVCTKKLHKMKLKNIYTRRSWLEITLENSPCPLSHSWQLFLQTFATFLLLHLFFFFIFLQYFSDFWSSHSSSWVLIMPMEWNIFISFIPDLSI